MAQKKRFSNYRCVCTLSAKWLDPFCSHTKRLERSSAAVIELHITFSFKFHFQPMPAWLRTDDVRFSLRCKAFRLYHHRNCASHRRRFNFTGILVFTLITIHLCWALDARLVEITFHIAIRQVSAARRKSEAS